MQLNWSCLVKLKHAYKYVFVVDLILFYVNCLNSRLVKTYNKYFTLYKLLFYEMRPFNSNCWRFFVYFSSMLLIHNELYPIRAYLFGMIFIRDFSSWNYMKKSKLIRLFLTWNLDCNRVNKYRRDRVGIRVLVPNTSHDRPQLSQLITIRTETDLTVDNSNRIGLWMSGMYRSKNNTKLNLRN